LLDLSVHHIQDARISLRFLRHADALVCRCKSLT
jgi:hypothetical protein